MAILEEPKLRETGACWEWKNRVLASLLSLSGNVVLTAMNMRESSFHFNGEISPALADLWVSEQGRQEGHDAVSRSCEIIQLQQGIPQCVHNEGNL